MEPTEELPVLERSNLNLEGIKIRAGHAITANKQRVAETNCLAHKQANPEYPSSILLRERRVESAD